MTKLEWCNRVGRAVASAGLVAAVGFGTVGCDATGRVKAKGTVDGAQFRLDAKKCEGEAGIIGTFKFHDNAGHVNLAATIFYADICSEVSGCETYCSADDYFLAAYFGPEEDPLSELVGVCLGDNGDGTGTFFLRIEGGPDHGYEHSGAVADADVDVKTCDE